MSRNVLLMAYIMAVWFEISFVTNLIGPLMPVVISDFHLSLALAGFLPFSFFLAYGLISIPAGALIEARGPRMTLLLAFALNLSGCLAISLWPTYLVVIAGLFVIGVGMAMQQVVINPLMRTTGGEAHFAFFSVMAQLVFGAASFVSPLVFAAVMKQPATPARPIVWVELYWAFVAVYVLLLLITSRLTIPQVTLAEDERPGTLAMYRSLMRERPVQLFFLGIIAYVGTEQSLADWMSQFLATYHHFSPTVEGARAVSLFWGLMSVGCLLGLVLLRLLDSKVVLGGAAVLALGCVALALFGPADVSLVAFPSAGFCLSVMWSIVFSLALNSVSRYHGAFSGILCTGILGGAVVPLLVGLIGDRFGLRLAMLTVLVTLGYILGIAFWARPLIRNQTVSVLELFNLRKKGSPAGAD
ncbi:MAG TPA: MFS transporter [Steroidobacteraceae bacterium]|nr:MFS transporter [Steroidobacteraceae bacterium]